MIKLYVNNFTQGDALLMIKKILILHFFILMFSFSFSDGVQSKSYKVDAINKAIEELKMQQAHLEL